MRVETVKVARHACRLAIGRKCGIGPRYVNRIIEAVVKLTLFYGVVVWQTAMEQGRYRAVLEKAYRLQEGAVYIVKLTSGGYHGQTDDFLLGDTFDCPSWLG